MKYPLTAQTKAVAARLVAAWNAGEIEPYATQRSNNSVSPRTMFSRVEGFDGGVMLELRKYGLIEVQSNFSADGRLVSLQIALLQELRNAVVSDFEVSDYFLTMNAVGNIIINSNTGPVQGIGYNTGTVQQTVEQLVDSLTDILGPSFLDTQTQLKEAIDELRTAVKADQKSKLGKVVSELGNCLQHSANAATVITGLSMITSFMYQLAAQM